MALDPRFRRYLEHYGRTVPVRDLVARHDQPDLTALRHDIDYDIDVAMEAAFWEERLGARASYYILHDAAYASDPRLMDKCLQIQDYGHEVGLHLNLLSAWQRGEIDDVAGELGSILDRWRGAGLAVTGAAAHGDKLCYEAGFANYWLFHELRPEDPAACESGITAEGTRASATDRAITYPAEGHTIRRADGRTFALWSLRLADFGLDYEASRVPVDHYFSDSGGSWKRSPDPIGEHFGSGRRMVLMHPIHWRHAQRHYYLLSTARSGSKWLATFLDQATSLTARHEFTLNHRLGADGPVPDKRTGAGFTGLMERKDEARTLIGESRSWSESLTTDFAEANIYLERFLALLPADDNNVHVHLQRDPLAVVRSLVGRGWYDVPFDDRHPAVDLPDWAQMRQAEQAAWYVRDANERLAKHCRHSLQFECMVADLGYLSGFLLELGIPVHPRLARSVFGDVINATTTWTVPPVEAWPEEDRAALARILGPVSGTTPGALGRIAQMLRRVAGKGRGMTGRGQAEPRPPTSLAGPDRWHRLAATTVSHAVASLGDAGLGLQFSAERAGFVLLGGGWWHGAKGIAPAYLRRLQVGGQAHALPVPRPLAAALMSAQAAGWRSLALSPRSLAGLALGKREPARDTAEALAAAARPAWGGFAIQPGSVYTLRLALRFGATDGALRLLLLSYDSAGGLLAQKDLGLHSPAWPELCLHFRPDRRAASFNLALYHGKDADQLAADIVEFQLASTPDAALNGRTPEQVLAALPADAHGAAELLCTRPLLAGMEELGAAVAGRNVATVRRGNVEVASAGDTLGVRLIRADRTGHLLLAPGLWQTCVVDKPGNDRDGVTWRIVRGAFLCGRIAVTGVSGESPVGVHLLSYDGKGILSEKILLARISEPGAPATFRMALIPDLAYVNVALMLAAGAPPMQVTDLQLVMD